MIRTLAKSIREYKKQTILTPALVAIEVALDILIPFIMAKIVDKGVYGGDLAIIYKLGALLVLLVGVSLTLGVLGGRFAAIAATRICQKLKT